MTENADPMAPTEPEQTPDTVEVPPAEAASTEAPAHSSAPSTSASAVDAEAPPSADAPTHEPSVGESSAAQSDVAQADGGPSEGTVDAAPGEDGEHKKKRRRRRRKKKQPGEEGEATASSPGTEESPRRSSSKDSHLPFQSFFEGAARRHAFSVGEAVAGRVVELGEESATVDLFGKATAFIRLHEPRDVPIPSHDDETEAEDEATPDEAVAAETAAPETAESAAPETAETETAAPEAAETSAPETAAPETAAAETAAPEASAERVAVGEAADEAGASGSDEAGDAEVAVDEAGAVEAARRARADEGPVEEPAYVVRPEGVPPVEKGQIFRGRVGAVAESGHIALVNELINKKVTRRALGRARDDRSRVPGLIFGYNRGGFDVLVYGLRAFCPVSGISLDNIEDPNPLLGQWGEFHVQTAKSGNQGLVVSRRSILEKESRKQARALLKNLQPGQTVKGRVTQVRDYGIFIDIGGVEGLAHQSELSWDRGARPSDVAKVGDEVDVQILKVHERENKRERFDRVSLSLKALAPDPWDEHTAEIQEGVARKGTVVRTAEFGAFVNLAPGIDGLLHVSELGKDLAHANLAVKEGDEIHIVVERVDKKARRISLSKLSSEEAALFDQGELVSPARRPQKVKQGEPIKVVVTQVTPGGLQVRIDNIIGKRGRGFIPNMEMGTARGTDHRKQWPPGTEMDVTVIGTDRDGGLRCSRKRFLQDEERRAVREYKKESSKQGFGTFADILRQKLGMDQDSSQ